MRHSRIMIGLITLVSGVSVWTGSAIETDAQTVGIEQATVYHAVGTSGSNPIEMLDDGAHGVFHSYVRDVTHVRPLHPDTLEYFVTASGFQHVRVEYRSPWPAGTKLEELPAPDAGASPDTPSAQVNLVLAFNHNVEKLNRLMFADQDYAVIGERR